MPEDKDENYPAKKGKNNLPRYEKQHYETLISLYKYTAVLVVGIITTILYLFGNSISDAKKNLTTDLDSLKSEIKLMRSASVEMIREYGSQAEKQTSLMRDNVQLYLDLTKDVTAMQIEAIREDAKNLALSSASAKIEEAFKANDIQVEIKEAAEREIGDQLELIVRRETEKMKKTFQDSIAKSLAVLDDFPIIAQATTMIYLGSKSSVVLLDSIGNYHNNENIRFLAKKTLLQKGVDYDNFILSADASESAKYNPEAQFGIRIDSTYSHNDKRKLVMDLINRIETDDDLYVVTSAFMTLRYISGNEIKTFDMTAIKKLKHTL